jgi:large subunit ribosomal protein L3
MIQGLLGKKIGMSRWFDEDGNCHGVTLISCGPCYVIENKGDNKIKIGYGEVKESKLTKPVLGYLKKNNVPPVKYQKEVLWGGKVDEMPGVGEKISVEVFAIGEKIDIQGISKGKGFAGVIKRWNFKGGPAGHGSHFHRAPGSIGQCADPSRVFPGKKMPGRKGGKNVTVSNLEILAIDKGENVIAVKGAVPGANKGLLFLQRNVKTVNLKTQKA